MRLPIPNRIPLTKTPDLSAVRQYAFGALLVTALVAFEVFNFDTTEFALASLLGEVSFAGIRWATILAIAFCAIDFAGLARIFTPESGWEEPRAIWYLTGAWLLGATMNAVMTWWAVNITLLSHDFGNEVLSRQQLLQIVPIFVAALVWLTRILFIGALSVAGGQLLAQNTSQAAETKAPAAHAQRATLRQRPTGDMSSSRLTTTARITDEPTVVHTPPADHRPSATPPRPTRVQRLPATLDPPRSM